MHIHMAKGDGYAKFWLNPLAPARSRRMKPAELPEARTLIQAHRRRIEDKWNEFLGA